MADNLWDEQKTEEVAAEPTKSPVEVSQGEEKPQVRESEQEDAKREESATTPVAKEEKAEKFIPEHRFKAALKNVTDERDALTERLKTYERGQQVEPDLSQVLLNERINQSRELMSELKEDYEEKETIFIDLAKADPALVEKMQKSSNPAKFAYNTAKEHLEVEDLKKLKGSDEFTEFQKWKAEKEDEAKKPKVEAETVEEKRKKDALSTPNLNKVSSAKIKDGEHSNDVWADSKF